MIRFILMYQPTWTLLDTWTTSASGYNVLANIHNRFTKSTSNSFTWKLHQLQDGDNTIEYPYGGEPVSGDFSDLKKQAHRLVMYLQ